MSSSSLGGYCSERTSFFLCICIDSQTSFWLFCISNVWTPFPSNTNEKNWFPLTFCTSLFTGRAFSQLWTRLLLLCKWKLLSRKQSKTILGSYPRIQRFRKSMGVTLCSCNKIPHSTLYFLLLSSSTRTVHLLSPACPHPDETSWIYFLFFFHFQW